MSPARTPQAKTTMSAARIRDTLGTNLRYLCAGEKSVSETCRKIGVNRTQFNRYLNGEAFPRPDILARICGHFGVDANILIRPLNEAVPTPTRNALEASFQRLVALLPDTGYQVPEALLPSGIYRSWRRSYMWSDHVFVTTCRIWREGEVTCWKAYEPIARNPLLLDGKLTMPERKAGHSVVMQAYRGFVLNVNHSICIFSAPPDGSRVFRMTTLRSGFEGMPHMYSGFATLTQAPRSGALSSVPVILESQTQTWRGMRAQSGEKSFLRVDELPPRLVRYMFDTPTF